MDTGTLTQLLTLAGLVALMASVGLGVQIGEIFASLRQTRVMALCLLANYAIIPAFTVLLLRWFNPELMVSVGFLIVAACPGAPLGPPLVATARGDVPCAIGQMVLLTLCSPVISPLLLTLLLAGMPSSTELRVDYLAIARTLVVGQLLPLAVGLGLRAKAPAIATRLVKPVRLFANAALICVVVLILVSEYETLGTIRARGWFGMLLLVAASFGAGWACGWPGLATQKSLALTATVRNAAVALVIVSRSFAETAAVTAVVAYSLVSIFASIGIAVWLKRMQTKSDFPHD